MIQEQKPSPTDNINDPVLDLIAEAKAASIGLLGLSDDKIDAILRDLAKELQNNIQIIISANKEDIKAAKDNGRDAAFIDRLALDAERINSIALSCENIAALPHPCGRILWEEKRPNGLEIQRVSVPFGLLGMIYESRPNVTIDAAALCLKSRNGVVLRGGSESFHSASALHSILQDVLEKNDVPKDCISMIPTQDREAVGVMLSASDYIDVVIPRGGKSLIERVIHEAKMPVFGHLEGLCHIYVHPSANGDMARDICLNAKLRRTGICGAMETLLLDNELDKQVAANILKTLLDEGCTIMGDKTAQALDPRIAPANESDWSSEYLGAKLSVKIVANVDDAIQHINHYGSHHTDSIIAEDQSAVQTFQTYVDSGIVMHNTSTQFADGGEFGMGAEIGIATGKMHARGPVGLEQLCTYKYIVEGSGQVRS